MPKVEKERGVAARVAGCAELRDILLFSAEVDLETPVIEGSLGYALKTHISYQLIGDERVESLVVTGEYQVDVDQTDEDAGDDDAATKVAEIKFTMGALFLLPEDHDGFEEEEFEAFARTSGQFALYPYAREYVADVTNRMGLPSLHIGVLRYELDSREGDDQSD